MKTCGNVLSAYTPTDERARAMSAPAEPPQPKQELPKKPDPGLNKSVYDALMGKGRYVFKFNFILSVRFNLRFNLK